MRLAVCVIVAAAGLLTFSIVRSERERERAAEASTLPSVLRHERNGLRYEYHVATGRESLFDVKSDPRGLRNIVETHRSEAAQCRAELEKIVGMNLDEVRASDPGAIARLHALGYF